MERQNTRFYLILALIAVGFFLYNAWQQEQYAIKPATMSSVGPSSFSKTAHVSEAEQDIPVAPNTETAVGMESEKVDEAIPAHRLVHVQTDVLDLDIDLKGGDIIRLSLPRYPETQDTETGYALLSNTQEKNYIAQSGLRSRMGPDSPQKGRATYVAKKKTYHLNDQTLVVDLTHMTSSQVAITKRYTFHKGSYLVDVAYIIDNQGTQAYEGSFYGKLKQTVKEEAKGFLGAAKAYKGAAVNTAEKKYLKLPFDKFSKEPFRNSRQGGWIAMVEHYFLSAWIPPQDGKNYFATEQTAHDQFGVYFISPATIVQPGEQKQVTSSLYVGPEVVELLEPIAPGLELTVDYGLFWPISQPIFWLMKQLHHILGNWGFAIIFTTLLIKLLFYRLSAASYRSMGNMRKLQPKIEALKQRCGEDKQKFGQEMMALYKKEKINPLGGCLPILIQIPVFIALYYVLLESVELRQAPFILWITDLSVKDPYYVLPLIMGASMLIQQKLNPAPPDPVQAKVMMAMPIVFTFLFLQFPAGLVLYWVVNNILSIFQQWTITRGIEKSQEQSK